MSMLACLALPLIPNISGWLFAGIGNLEWFDRWGNAQTAWTIMLCPFTLAGLWLVWRAFSQIPVFSAFTGLLGGVLIFSPLSELIQSGFRPVTKNPEWELLEFWKLSGAHFLLLAYAAFLAAVALVVWRDARRVASRPA